VHAIDCREGGIETYSTNNVSSFGVVEKSSRMKLHLPEPVTGACEGAEQIIKNTVIYLRWHKRYLFEAGPLGKGLHRLEHSVLEAYVIV